MPQLTDVLVDRPRILFVGINPGLRSAAAGHHFAGPGNPFWRLLHAAQLVPEPMTSEQDRDLARHGLALTNLCPRPTRSAAELGPEERARGARGVARKARRLRPDVVAFVGLTVYQACARADATPGPGPKASTFEGARVFVLPNPSGLNASYPGFESKLVWFRLLARFAGLASLATPEGRPGPASPDPGRRAARRKPRRAGPRASASAASERSGKEAAARAGGDPSRAARRRGKG